MAENRDPSSDRYVPALKWKRLTSFYDAFMAITMPEVELHRTIGLRADAFPHQRVIDVGCGTGTLMRFFLGRFPTSEVKGIDIDPAMLDQAAHKLMGYEGRSSLHLQSASDLPFSAGTFDLVVSMLAFHHMPHEVKERALREIYRVLMPSGHFLLMDFGAPEGMLSTLLTNSIHLLDGLSNTADNRKGRMPQLIQEAGFLKPEKVYSRLTFAGTVELLVAKKYAHG